MGEIEGEQKRIAGSKLLCDLGVEPQYVWNRLTGQSFSGIKKKKKKKKKGTGTDKVTITVIKGMLECVHINIHPRWRGGLV